MHFLVLLTALVACAASKCYNTNTVVNLQGVPFEAKAPRLDGRIVGGTPTKIEYHPYEVSLRYNGSHFCGGSIVNKNWVVTAAECVAGKYLIPVTAVAGSTTLSPPGSTHKVIGGYIHGGYNSNTRDNDVAVLEVSPPFTYSDSVQPIALESADALAGTSVVVTGWGATLPRGSVSNTLLEATLQTVNVDSCNKTYSGNITKDLICAGSASEYKGPCDGDEGDPLVTLKPLSLVGILSWGPEKCGTPGIPGVYIKVSAVRDWILRYTGLD